MAANLLKAVAREILPGVSSLPPPPAPFRTLPRWLSVVLGLIPVLPPLYLLAFGALGALRRLPQTARWVLLIFALSQVVAAFFTPQPLLSLAAGSLRTLYLLAMVAAGAYLQSSNALRPLLWGQVVILLSAWGYTLLTQGSGGVLERLGHPYYYIVSLGLVGSLVVWQAVFWRGGALWWRLGAGLLGVATLLASGSRGPLLALLVGTAAAFVFTGRKAARNWLLAATVALAGLAYLASRPGVVANPVGRFFDKQVSGRNFVWQDAYAGWQTSPIGGLGPYQGGPYLNYLFKDGCQLTPTLERNDIKCPVWLTNLNGVWLIAHNAWLHWLMETGVIGLGGLLLVYGYGLWASARSRDPLLIAIVYGFSAMNVVDVVIAVPSQHFAELWWAALGLSFWRLQVGPDAAKRQTPTPPPSPNSPLPTAAPD